MRELDTRLAASRRELGRRASEAEAAAADDDEVSTRASATARLQAAVRLLEMRRRRLRAVAEACARMVHAAANDDRTKPALADLLASLQAERRALEWELDGTLARLAALGADVPPMGDGEEPPSQHAGDAGR
jgi:hypothetical protein